MSQIPSLKTLNYCYGSLMIFQNIPFTLFPKAKDCLTNLSIFKCNSNVLFLGQLSQICYHIQSLAISLTDNVSNGLIELILSQKNLKDLKLYIYEVHLDWSNIIPALTKHYNTLTNFFIHGDQDIPFSFIASFINLQQIVISISSSNRVPFIEFDQLQHTTFTNLRTFKILYDSPKSEILMKFLETNGKNLNDLNTSLSYDIDKSLKKSLVQYCPNLQKLFIKLENDELDILKSILKGCQHLEGIKVQCGNLLNGKEFLDTILKDSPKNFYELKINEQLKLLPGDLESFFSSWEKRIPQKPLTLIIVEDIFSSKEVDEENIKIIEKFQKLGIIKKFDFETFDEEEIFYF